MVFTAVATYRVKASAFRGMVSELITFVALNELQLGSVFLHRESLLVDVNSMFDALIGHICFGEEHYEMEVVSVVLEFSSQWFHFHYLKSISLVLMF